MSYGSAPTVLLGKAPPITVYMTRYRTRYVTTYIGAITSFYTVYYTVNDKGDSVPVTSIITVITRYYTQEESGKKPASGTVFVIPQRPAKLVAPTIVLRPPKLRKLVPA